MDVLKVLLYVAQFLVAVSLIVLVVLQTSRHEGLGVVGGGSSGPTRGRAGIDERMSEWTRYCAIAFMVLTTILYVLGQRLGWH